MTGKPLRSLFRRRASGGGELPDFELLTRPGCHLCDEMADLLDEELPRYGASYTARNVDGDPRVQERFGDTVPVLLRDGLPVAKVRLTPEKLRRIVRRGR